MPPPNLDMTATVIRCEVDEVSKLTAEYRDSPTKFVAGLSWRLSVKKECSEKTGYVPYLAVFLRCNEESECDLWSAETICTLTVLNADSDKNRSETNVPTFNKRVSPNCGRFKFMPFAKILNPQEGFINDDRIVVEARIIVTKANGFVAPLEFNFSIPRVGTDNIELVIEGETVHVNKNFLAMHSPVFDAMFHGEFVEKNLDKIELKGMSREEFIELLYVIYPSYRPITRELRYLYSKLLCETLTLADFYQIKYATNLAESYLIKTKKFTTTAKLLLADKFRLDVLKKQCLTSLKDLKSVKALESAQEYKELSPDMKCNILSHVMQLIE